MTNDAHQLLGGTGKASQFSTTAAKQPGDVLPVSYQVQTPYEVPDKQLVKSITSNAIVQLCTRLATFRCNRDFTCYDPKRLGVKLSHKQRLYSMIGYRLRCTTYRRMCLLSSKQWRNIENSWIAVMHTVLLHTEFNPLLRDSRLRKSISKFKLWFIEFAMKGHTALSAKGRRYVVLEQFDKLLSGLKSIAGWFQYYALDNALNARAPTLSWFIGWQSNAKLEYPTFPWYGGHLRRFRKLENLEKSDLDIRTLCQIRTFGRALPPPSEAMCVADLHEQMNVLTTHNHVEKHVLDKVSECSALIAENLNVSQMHTSSHISVSTSGCFEVTQKDGGLAAYIRGWVKELDHPLWMIRVRINGELHPLLDVRALSKRDNFIDCYGNIMFPIRWAADDPDVDLSSEKARERVIKYAYRGERHKNLLDKFYRQSGHFRKANAVRDLIKRDLYPSEICAAVLAVASSEAILQGYYHDCRGNRVEPHGWLVLPSGREIPFWNSQEPLRYKSVDFPHVEMQCLAEPGAKTRSLGKSQAWFTIVTKIMRFMIEPILARDGRARIGLCSTNKMWSFLKMIQRKKPKGQWLQSTDYRAATDYISLDMLYHMWTPFCERLQRKHPFLVYKDLIFCRRNLHCSGKFAECLKPGMVHKCGSFMGEPMSFMSLTLINLVIENITAYWPNERSLYLGPMLGLRASEMLAICGDDVASLRRGLNTIKRFKTVTADVGMKLSWKDGVSRRTLIFCEDHILVDKDNTYIYVDVVKSRLLTTMARQHSDNRSSILGKGRMLKNQLNYFNSNLLKIFVTKIFDQIFDRAHGYSMGNMKLPYFLPPSCGGLGYPIPETLMPEWAYMYIGYIFSILEEPSALTRYFKLYEISSLTKRNKHGIDNSENAIDVFRRMSKLEDIQYSSDYITAFKARTVYPDWRIRELLEEFGINIPTDPYTGGPDRDHLRNEASRFGIIQLNDLFEQIERTLNFDVFFREEVTRQQRTFKTWISLSKRYWGRTLFKASSRKIDSYISLGKEKFVSLEDLDNKVSKQWFGYVFPDNWKTLATAGPSLQINFRHFRAGEERYPFRDQQDVDVKQLFYKLPYATLETLSPTKDNFG